MPVDPTLLTVDPMFPERNEFLDAMLAANEGLEGEQSQMFNAWLVLIMANQIRDIEVLKACVEKARSMFD